jgi:aquaporin rerated protein, other eukaryote
MFVSKDGEHAVGGFTNATAGLLNRTSLRIPPIARSHLVAVLGELTGRIFFLSFAFAGTQVANVSSNTNTGTTMITTTVQKTPQQLLYISLAFGFSLAVNMWVYFRISGDLFNKFVDNLVRQ